MILLVLTNFRFCCSLTLHKCFPCSCAFISPRRSGTILALTCNSKVQKSAVVNLITRRGRMSKKDKVSRGTQQDAESSQSKEGKGGISSVISSTKDGQICVKILAKPGAKQSNVTDISVDGVGVQIGAPAREGEANEELVRYLAEVLNVRKRSISLDKGSKSRQKVVTIESTEISVEQVRQRFSKEALQY